MPNLRSFVAGATLASGLLAQVPCYDSNIGAGLNVGDDQIIQGLNLGFTFTYNGVGYTAVCVDSNGSIYLGGTTAATTDWTPTVTEFDNSVQPRICGLWNDFNASATGAGDVHFNAIPAAGPNPAYALVTWSQVVEFGRGLTNLLDVQVKLDANNLVTVHYGVNTPIGGTLNPNMIIGATPGLGALSTATVLAPRPVTVPTDAFNDLRTTSSGPSGFTMTWVPTLPGFQVIDAACGAPGTAVIVGTGCPALTGLTAGDDTTHPISLPFSFPHATGPYTQIYVSSNGFLTLGATNPGSGCCAGAAAGLLAGPARIAALWTDLNASNTSTSGNGEVYIGTDAAGGFVVTWHNVGEFAIVPPTSNQCQIALYPTGAIHIRYGTVGITGAGHTTLAGYSDGGAAIDPGASDLSALVGSPIINTIYETFAPSSLDLSGLNFLLLPTGAGTYLVVPGAAGPYVPPILPLNLQAAAGSRPAIGTTFNMDVSNISPAPNGIAALLFIGFTELNPAVDLGPVLGATGCNAYLFPIAMEFLNLPLGAPTTSFGVGVPNNATLLGAQAMAEAVSDDSGANSFGWKFSNGLRLTVGL